MRTLIIGGGLSGLALAEILELRGHDYLLMDARDRFGGRIKTQRHAGAGFDLGPAWFWPGQPRILALIERLGLEKFDQFADGLLSVEDEYGGVQRGRGYASMQGSWRLKGGLGVLTERLAAQLPAARKRLGTRVTGLTWDMDGVKANIGGAETLVAEQVVLALPPRLGAELNYTPDLPDDAIGAMRSVPTWMAAQAKAVAVFDRPFWRAAGLSGDAMSRSGPMVEIHDASPAEGGPYALFGFIGVPFENRQDEKLLRQRLLAQLIRLFGVQAERPVALYVKDWACDRYTAATADQAPIYAHPTYGMPPDMLDLWGGRLHFAGTEVAPHFGGYIEGALEAAENVLRRLER